MILDELTVGPVQTRCYILGTEDGKDCIIIDPGDEAERIRKAVGDREISAILLTCIFFGLTIGYVFHYYFLENSVQKMYHMRDEIIAFLDKDLKDIGLTESGAKKV